MSTETKHRVISSFVTALVMSVLLFVLYFFGMYSQIPPALPKQMILIELTSGGGGGGGSTMPKSAKQHTSAAPNIATQNAEEAPIVSSNPKSEKEKSENDIASEPKPDPGVSYRPGKGGGSGGGSGTGTGTGAGMGYGSGEGAGGGSGKGIGYGSGNRSYVNIPDVNISENGVVYVEVHVTAQGNVINARILNTSKYPTNITNAQIQRDCISRALNAKYVSGKEELRVIVFK